MGLMDTEKIILSNLVGLENQLLCWQCLQKRIKPRILLTYKQDYDDVKNI